MTDWEMVHHRINQIETRLATHRRDPELASILSALRDELARPEENIYTIELDPAAPNRLAPWKVTMPGREWHAESEYDAVRQLRVQMEQIEYEQAQARRNAGPGLSVPFDIDTSPAAQGPDWVWPDDPA